MGITGDQYVGEYEGHIIELVRNAWVKTLELRIDGNKVASESCMLPHNITLTGAFEHNGVQHSVTAISLDRFPFTTDTIEVDGNLLALTKSK